MDSKVCFSTFPFTLWIRLWILVQMVYLMDLLMDSGKTGLPYRFEIWIQTAQNRDRLPYGFGLWIHTLENTLQSSKLLKFSSLAPPALAYSSTHR